MADAAEDNRRKTSEGVPGPAGESAVERLAGQRDDRIADLYERLLQPSERDLFVEQQLSGAINRKFAEIGLLEQEGVQLPAGPSRRLNKRARRLGLIFGDQTVEQRLTKQLIDKKFDEVRPLLQELRLRQDPRRRLRENLLTDVLKRDMTGAMNAEAVEDAIALMDEEAKRRGVEALPSAKASLRAKSAAGVQITSADIEALLPTVLRPDELYEKRLETVNKVTNTMKGFVTDEGSKVSAKMLAEFGATADPDHAGFYRRLADDLARSKEEGDSRRQEYPIYSQPIGLPITHEFKTTEDATDRFEEEWLKLAGSWVKLPELETTRQLGYDESTRQVSGLTRWHFAAGMPPFELAHGPFAGRDKVNREEVMNRAMAEVFVTQFDGGTLGQFVELALLTKGAREEFVPEFRATFKGTVDRWLEQRLEARNPGGNSPQ